MQRYEIINYLIEKNKFKSYLEIGTQLDNCLKEINCRFKVGVDPDGEHHKPYNSDQFYRMTSDNYFIKNKFELGQSFDIIFIDGLHEKVQILRDIESALLILNEGGFILVHDCNPLTYEAQLSVSYVDGKLTIPHVATWNGDVWKSWVKLRYLRSDLEMYCIETDQGCGLIRKGKQETIKLDVHIDSINFNQLNVHRKIWLNLMSVEKFLKMF